MLQHPDSVLCSTTDYFGRILEEAVKGSDRTR
jgi:hypothetical protein